MKALFISLVLVFAGLPLLSQAEDFASPDSYLAMYEDLFSAEEPVHLTLKFDLKALQKTRHQDKFQNAEMTHVVSDDVQLIRSVQVKPRDIIHRKFCILPPIWVHIPNSGNRTDSLQGGWRMNMVLPCKQADRFESFVLREYLAYKFYHVISPLSYRVRLVRLSIIDTGRGNEVSEGWAFIQEPDELMALRLKGKTISNNELSMSMMNPEVMNSLSMFQYMIGNADYAVTGRHKLKILALNSGKPSGFLPVPYDFDFSGLVNADYAVPGEALGTTSIRERYYLGPCRPEQVHKETIQELATFEDKIKEYIQDFEYLDEKEKTDMIEYLDSYFLDSRESGFIDRRIASTCR